MPSARVSKDISCIQRKCCSFAIVIINSFNDCQWLRNHFIIGIIVSKIIGMKYK